MTLSSALRSIRGYASANRVSFSTHAYDRMVLRGATKRDVVHALAKAYRCDFTEEPERWKVIGPDTDGDDLTTIVKIEDGVLVITVF